MKIIKFLTIGLLVSGATLLTSCKKEEGPVGPAGPVGAAGKDGKDGNANVKSSTLFITGSEWVFSSGEASVTKQVPEITSDIVNSGVVMVYSKTSSGGWEAMPSTYASSNGVVLTFGFSIETGKLNLYITWNTTATLTGADIGNQDFRVAVISAAALAKNPDIDLNDFNQVQKVTSTQ